MKRFQPSVLAFLICGAMSLQAQVTYTWTGGGADDSVLTALNWTAVPGPLTPGPLSDVIFPTTSPNVAQIVMAAPVSFDLRHITFSGASRPAYTFNGSGSTLLTLYGDLTVGAGGDVTLNSSVPILLKVGSHVVTVDSGVTTTVNGTVGESGGAGGLTKLGQGTLTFSGANSYTGGTTINQGTLRLSGGGSLASGSNMVVNGTSASGATFDLNGLSQNIGTLTFGGPGASSSATNTVTLGSGTLTLGGNVTYDATNNPLSAALSGGTLSLGGANRIFSVGNSSGASIDLVISSVISGGNSITKTGLGTLSLSGTNTFTGTTTIADGRVVLGAADALATSSGIIINASTSGQTTALDAGSLIQNVGPVTLGGVGLSISSITTGAGGALTVGPLTLGGGVSGHTSSISLNATSSLTLAGDLTYNATNNPNGVSITGGTGSTGALVLFGTRTFAIGDSTAATSDVTVSARITGGGGMIKTGAGTLVLSNGTNSYLGQTWIKQGVLSASRLAFEGSNSSLGAPTGPAAIIKLGELTSSATLRYNGSLFSNTNRQIDLAGTTGGATLEVIGGGNAEFLGNIFSTGAGSKTLTLAGDTNQTPGIFGIISDNSATNKTAVQKTGFGNWRLGGVNTYTGGTTISGGQLLTLNNSLPATGAVTINASGSSSLATLNLLGHTQTTAIGGLTFGGAGASPFARNQLLLGDGGLLTLGGDITALATSNPSGAVISAYDVSAGNYPLGGSLSFDNATRTLNVQSSPNSRQDLTIYSNIIASGGAGLTKTGAGSLALAGQSTYTGATTISAGTLLLASSTNDTAGLVSGPVGRGTLVMENGTTLAATRLFDSFNLFSDDVRISNPVSLANNVTLGSMNMESDSHLDLAGNVTAASSTTRIHLGGPAAVEFSGALKGVDLTSITFDSGAREERGLAILRGSVEATVGSLTLDHAAMIFAPTQVLPPGLAIQATSGGYVGAMSLTVGGLSAAEMLLSRITQRGTFSGTFGLDTDPNAGAPGVFANPFNFSGFGSSFTFGSMTGAIVQGPITPPSGGYSFGDGGGFLIVQSTLANAGGATGVWVHSSPGIPSNALTAVFQGNNTFTGGLTATNSLAILDSPTALPSGGLFSMGSNGYVGHTERFGGGSFTHFASRMVPGGYAPDGTSVLGFDSADVLDRLIAGDLCFEDAYRLVSEPLDLTAFGRIYVGTATRVAIAGRIIAPNASGADRTLSLIAAHGEGNDDSSLRAALVVATPLGVNDVKRVVVGSSGGMLENGEVALIGANTYTQGTTLLGGILRLSNNTRLSGTGDILSGPLGTGTLTIPASSMGAVLAAAGEDCEDLLVFNPIDLGGTLQIGLRGDENSQRIILNGAIRNVADGSGGLEIFSATTLSGANSFSGGVALRGGRLTIGSDTALGSGTLKIEPMSDDDAPSVSLAVANGPRTIGNNVVINAFADDYLKLRGNGSLTVNGSVTLNSNVTFGLGDFPLILNGNVGGMGRLSVDGSSTLFLNGSTNNFSGGVDAVEGSIVFMNNLPASGQLTAEFDGYIGIGFVPSNLQNDFINRFNKSNMDGTIGLDGPLTGTARTYSGSLSLVGFPSDATRLGSATRAILTASLSPQGSFYMFGGGGGLLEVNSGLADGTSRRFLEVHSPEWAPLTLRLGGTNTYSAGEPNASTYVYASGLIFKNGSMPTDGKFEVFSGGYIGTEDPTGAQTLINRLSSTGHYGTIGFDSFTGTYTAGGTLNLGGLSAGAQVYLGTATAATISAAITLPPTQTAFRFAGYKGGNLTVSTLLDGVRSVIIGDPYNRATFRSPVDPLGPISSVTLSGANTYSGGTALHAGELLAGSNTALGSGPLNVDSYYFDGYNSAYGAPIFGTSAASLSLANQINLANGLVLGGSHSFTLDGAITGGGQLVKTGATSVTLNGDNSAFWGGIRVAQGSLVFGHAHAAGSGPLELVGSSSPSISFQVNAVLNGISGGSSGDQINLASGTTLTINQYNDASFAGRFAGAGSVYYTGPFGGYPRDLRLSGASTYTGNTTISSGVQVVAAHSNAFGPASNVVKLEGGVLAVEQGVTITNPLDLRTGTLGGIGTIKPPATVMITGDDEDQVVLAPGFSTGTLTFDGGLLAVSHALVLGSGGKYKWELADANNPNGGWDIVSVVSGTVGISATPAQPFQFEIVAPDTSLGSLNFNPTQAYSWTVLTASSISGFTGTNQFALDASDLFSGSALNHFYFSLGPGNSSLVLNFSPVVVPEPSTYAMLALGLGAVAFVLRGRRRI